MAIKFGKSDQDEIFTNIYKKDLDHSQNPPKSPNLP